MHPNKALERFAVRRHMIHSYPRLELVLAVLFWAVAPLYSPQLLPASIVFGGLMLLALAVRWMRTRRQPHSQQEIP